MNDRPTEPRLPAARLEAEISTRSQEQAENPLLSPGLARPTDSAPGSTAYELKFLVPGSVAEAIEAWSHQHLSLDPFVDRQEGCYRTTTLYLDTPDYDVLSRSPGFRKRKHRLRRYGNEEQVYLEQKSRKSDRVSKKRTIVHSSELARLDSRESDAAWHGDWFHERVQTLVLIPACVLTYARTAFAKLTPGGVVRLTLDRDIRGALADGWQVPAACGREAEGFGPDLLEGSVVCELKFRDAMPLLFKQLVAEMKLEPGSVSKYRRMMQSAGITPRPPMAAPSTDDSSIDLPQVAAGV